MASFKELQELLPYMTDEEKALVTKGKPELLQYSHQEFVDLYNNMNDEEKSLFDYDDLAYGGYTEAIKSAPQAALGGLQSAAGGTLQAAGEFLDMPQTAQYGAETFQAGQQRTQEALQGANLQPGSGPELVAAVAPEAAIQVPLVVGAAAVPEIGVPAMVGMMTARSGGTKYGVERQKGSSPERAAAMSSAYGVAEFAGEALGAKYLSSLLKTPAGKNVLMGILSYIGKETSSELGTEALQSGVDYLSKKTGGKLTPEEEDYGKRALDTIKQTALLSPILGGAGMTTNLMMQGRKNMVRPEEQQPVQPPAEPTPEERVAAEEQLNQMFAPPAEQVQPNIAVEQPVQETPPLAPENLTPEQNQTLQDYVDKVTGMQTVQEAPPASQSTPEDIAMQFFKEKAPKPEPTKQDINWFMNEIAKSQPPTVQEVMPEQAIEMPTVEPAPKEPIKIEEPPAPVIEPKIIEAISAANIPVEKQAELIQEMAKPKKEAPVKPKKQPLPKVVESVSAKNAPTEQMVRPMAEEAPAISVPTPEPSITSLEPPQSTIEEMPSVDITEPQITQQKVDNEPKKPEPEIYFWTDEEGEKWSIKDRLNRAEDNVPIFDVDKDRAWNMNVYNNVLDTQRAGEYRASLPQKISILYEAAKNEDFNKLNEILGTAGAYPAGPTIIMERIKSEEKDAKKFGFDPPPVFEEVKKVFFKKGFYSKYNKKIDREEFFWPLEIQAQFGKNKKVNPKIKKAVPSDQENVQRLPSQERVGQKPIQAQPAQEVGVEAVERGGILQKQEEVIPAGKTPEERSKIRHDSANKISSVLAFGSAPKASAEDVIAMAESANKQGRNLRTDPQGLSEDLARELSIIETNSEPNDPRIAKIKKDASATISKLQKYALETTGLEYTFDPNKPSPFKPTQPGPKVGMSYNLMAKNQPQPSTAPAPARQPRPAAKLKTEPYIYTTDIMEAAQELGDKYGYTTDFKAVDMNPLVDETVTTHRDDTGRITGFTININRATAKDKADVKRKQRSAAHGLGHAVIPMADDIDGRTLSHGNIFGVALRLKNFFKSKISMDNKVTEKALAAEAAVPKPKNPKDPVELAKYNRERRQAYIDTIEKSGKPYLEKDEITRQAVELKLEWEGLYIDELSDKEIKYISNPQEIYASLIDILINRPDMLKDPQYTALSQLVWKGINENASGIKDALVNFMLKARDRKAGNEPHTDMERRINVIRESEAAAREKATKRAEVGKGVTSLEKFMNLFVDLRYQGQKFSKETKDLIQQLDFQRSKVEGLLSVGFPDFFKKLNESGVSYEEFAAYLDGQRVINEYEPGGKMSRFDYDQLKNEYASMDKDLKDALEDLRKSFREAIRPFQNDLIESGALTPEMNKKIASNDYYVRYEDLERYIDDEKIVSGPRSQGAVDVQKIKGSLSEMRDPILATMEYFIAVAKSVMHNNAKKALAEDLQKNGLAKPANIKYGEGGKPIIEADAYKRTLIYRVDGKLNAMEVEPQYAEVFDFTKADNFGTWSYITNFLKASYTTLAPGFWPAQVARDFLNSFVRIPGTAKNFPSFIKQYAKALRGALFETPEFQEKKRKGLTEGTIIGNYSNIWGDDYVNVPTDEKMAEIIMREHGLSSKESSDAYKDMNIVHRAFKKYGDFTERITKQLEYAAKISVDEFLKETNPNMSDAERRLIVRNLASQNFKARGKYTNAIGQAYLFTNPFIQSWRSDIEAVKNDPAGYMAKTIALGFTPILLLAFAASSSEEWKKWLRRQSEHDLRNYLVFPTFAKDPKTGEEGIVRIPLPETARLLHGLSYEAILKPIVNSEIKRDWSDALADSISYMGGQVPSKNPIWEAAQVAYYTASGKAAYDDYRQTFIIPAEIAKLGLKYSWPELLKYEIETLSGGWIPTNKKSFEGEQSPLEAFLDTWGVKSSIGRWIRFGNRGEKQREFLMKKAEDKENTLERDELKSLWQAVVIDKSKDPAKKKRFYEMLSIKEKTKDGRVVHPNRNRIKNFEKDRQDKKL